MLTTTLFAQGNVYRFQSSHANINKQGEKFEAELSELAMINVDLDAGTVMVETTSEDLTTMFRNKLEMNIDKQMGEFGDEFSLQLDEFILAHFYVNMGMIMFTRTDVHPLKWGIQFTSVEQK